MIARVNSRQFSSVLAFITGEVIAADVPRRIRVIMMSGYEGVRADRPTGVCELLAYRPEVCISGKPQPALA